MIRLSISNEDTNFSHAQIPELLRELPCSSSTDAAVSFPEVRRQERESGHLLLSRAEVKDEWSYASAPCLLFVCLHGVHKKTFILTAGCHTAAVWLSNDSCTCPSKRETSVAV
jgi:hypothetical protein